MSWGENPYFEHEYLIALNLTHKWTHNYANSLAQKGRCSEIENGRAKIPMQNEQTWDAIKYISKRGVARENQTLNSKITRLQQKLVHLAGDNTKTPRIEY